LNNSNYPPPVVPSSVFVDVIFDGKIGKSSEVKVMGVGVGKRVNWKDVEVVSNTLKTQMHRYTLEIVTYPCYSPRDVRKSGSAM